MSSKPVTQSLAWAAVSIGTSRSRSRYIHHDTIRTTRKASKKAYRAYWRADLSPEDEARVMGYVTFEHVVVLDLETYRSLK